MFQFLLTASCPTSEYPQEEPGSVFTPSPSSSLYTFIHIDKIPFLLSKLNSPSSLNFSSYSKCAKPLTVCVPVLDAHHICRSFSY